MGQWSRPSLHTLWGETGWALSSVQKNGIQAGFSPRDLETACEGLERSWSVLSTPQCLCSTFGKCKIKSCWWVSLCPYLTQCPGVWSPYPHSQLQFNQSARVRSRNVLSSEALSLVVELHKSLGTGVIAKVKFKPPAKMLLASFRSSHLINLIFKSLKWTVFLWRVVWRKLVTIRECY